jgi:hypothetical protein
MRPEFLNELQTALRQLKTVVEWVSHAFAPGLSITTVVRQMTKAPHTAKSYDVAESEIPRQKLVQMTPVHTDERRKQSSANSSRHVYSLFCGKIQGNSPTSAPETTIAGAFVLDVQSLTTRIP